MKARTKWLFVGAVSLAGMVVSLTFSSPRQPRYEGRALDEWLDDFSNPHFRTQEVAKAAIRAIGPAAVPFLTNALEQRRAISLRANEKAASRRVINWGRSLVNWHQPMMESRNAAIALQTLGPAATNAIPSLVAALSDRGWTVAQAAAIALASMGTNVAPALEERLYNATGEELSWTLHAVVAMGTNAASLAPALGRHVQVSTNSPIEPLVLMALAQVRSAGVPVLTNLLTNTDAGVQTKALQALAQIGLEAQTATSAFIGLAASTNANVRLQARYALAATMAPREISLPVWLAGLNDRDPRIVELSLRQLTIYPANVRAFNREIATLTTHPADAIREKASNALTTFRAWPK